MLFGLEQTGKVLDELKEKLEELDNAPEDRDLENVRTIAEKCQEKAQAYNKLQYDRKARKPSQHKKGDYVMVKNFDSTTGVSRKLIPKNKGPYVISKVLRNDRLLLKYVEGFQVSRNPYQGLWSINNIKHWVGSKKK